MRRRSLAFVLWFRTCEHWSNQVNKPCACTRHTQAWAIPWRLFYDKCIPCVRVASESCVQLCSYKHQYHVICIYRIDCVCMSVRSEQKKRRTTQKHIFIIYRIHIHTFRVAGGCILYEFVRKVLFMDRNNDSVWDTRKVRWNVTDRIKNYFTFV